MAKLYQQSLRPGVKVKDASESFVIVEVLNAHDVVVQDAAGRRRAHRAADLVIESSEVIPSRQLDIEAIPQEQWDRASRIVEAIRPLVEQGPYRRTKEQVQRIADQFLVHSATAYRWIKEYEATGTVSSLVRKIRSDKGKARLDEAVEKVIQDCIDELYLNTQQPSIAKTASEARRRAKLRGLAPPDENTVRTRILAIDEAIRVRRREGSKAADERFQPTLGSFPGADFPLAVVQIDHTPMDVIIVDDVHRRPIGRPWLTIAIDVYSKMCVGFYLSLDHPGALATGLCLSRAILGKERWLEELELSRFEWPCHGLMRTIHSDNAKEFRGELLQRAVKEYDIIAQRRPKGRPRYGGHVERAFRTYMQEVHDELPGTTRSNPRDRGEYDSEGKAIMSLHALEVWFALFLLGDYHQKPHEGNDLLPPIVKWERGIMGDPANGLARGIPARFQNEERLRLDFLPFQERTVQEYGIQIESIQYWSDALRRLVHARSGESIKTKKKFICRYDPRDMSRIWMFEPEANEYIELPYRNISRPNVSLWEIRAAKKALREDSRASTNEELIFRTIDDMREIVKQESHRTKAARRMQQRQKSWAKKTGQGAVDAIAPAETKHKVVPSSAQVVDDSEVFEPFEGIREA